MSQKQDKSRVFVVFLVIMVVAIIAVGLFFTWFIIKEGEKNKPNEAYIIEQERADYSSLLFRLVHFNDNKISIF